MTETTAKETLSDDERFKLTILTRLTRMHHVLEEMTGRLQELYNSKLTQEAEEYAQRKDDGARPN